MSRGGVNTCACVMNPNRFETASREVVSVELVQSGSRVQCEHDGTS